MKEIGERWALMYERWEISAERFGNAWQVWFNDQINDRLFDTLITGEDAGDFGQKIVQ